MSKLVLTFNTFAFNTVSTWEESTQLSCVVPAISNPFYPYLYGRLGELGHKLRRASIKGLTSRDSQHSFNTFNR